MVLTDLLDPACINEQFSVVEEKCKIVEIKVTSDQAITVEKETRVQSNCKAWFRFRSGRVTASRIKSACRTNLEKPSVSLIKAVCYPEATRFSNAAPTWGIKNEAVAREAYLLTMKEKHKNFELTLCGLVIHPDYPCLGASPDGLVFCH